MTDYLEVAKECGAIEAGNVGRRVNVSVEGHIIFTKEELDAYTSRILASQKAAHDAEIASYQQCVKDDYCKREALDNQLSTANERIAYLEVLVALQADALNEVGLNVVFDNDGQLAGIVTSAISATAKTVAKYKAELTEPLRREVAMLRDVLAFYQLGGSNYSAKANKAINNTQATAQAYEQEVEARGAGKALEDWKPTEEEILAYGEGDGQFDLFAAKDDALAIATGVLELVQIKINATSKKG